VTQSDIGAFHIILIGKKGSACPSNVWNFYFERAISKGQPAHAVLSQAAISDQAETNGGCVIYNNDITMNVAFEKREVFSMIRPLQITISGSSNEDLPIPENPQNANFAKTAFSEVQISPK